MGSEFLIELDIVMPPETPLTVAHDVAESLQQVGGRLIFLKNCECEYEVGNIADLSERYCGLIPMFLLHACLCKLDRLS